jgi:hypothetical protein
MARPTHTITFATVFLIVVWHTYTVTALTVYDCQHPNATITILDLTEPAPCSDPTSDYHDPEDFAIQVLQAEADFTVTAHQCDVIMTTKICHCGDLHHSFGCFFDKWERQVHVPVESCRDMLDGRPLVFMDRSFKVAPGRKISHTFFSHGGTGDSTCVYGVVREEAGNVHFKAYQEVILTIALFTHTATVDALAGTIKFPFGMIAPFPAGVARDAQKGTLLWTANQPACAATVSELYLGAATIRRQEDRERRHGQRDCHGRQQRQ